MAALLNNVDLRRHALLPGDLSVFDRFAGTADRYARPCLVATWRLGPDGRPVCRWTVDDAAIWFPPPD